MAKSLVQFKPEDRLNALHKIQIRIDELHGSIADAKKELKELVESVETLEASRDTELRDLAQEKMEVAE